jgi:hypothetical protein
MFWHGHTLYQKIEEGVMPLSAVVSFSKCLGEHTVMLFQELGRRPSGSARKHSFALRGFRHTAIPEAVKGEMRLVS